MPDVFCTCKSHCTAYNRETAARDGGEWVSRTTASRHRMDDNRSPNLDGFASHITSSILNETPGLEFMRTNTEATGPSPLQIAAIPGEVITIEGEIRDRISWTPTAKPLVFAIDPVPDCDFEDPLISPHYIPNDGPHVLQPMNPNNIAFIENEGRLYEILGNLRADLLGVDQEVLDDLVDKVTAGLRRMMEHKRCEWERQRSKTQAIRKGHAVINTG